MLTLHYMSRTAKISVRLSRLFIRVAQHTKLSYYPLYYVEIFSCCKPSSTKWCILARIASTASSARCGLFIHMSWRRMVFLSVCLCVSHVKESCKNGRTDRDAVWGGGGRLAWTEQNEACVRWGAHWRHLVSAIERSVLDGDAGRCSATLATWCVFRR